jgi:hypothetical protein
VGKLENERRAEEDKKRIAEIRFDSPADILKFTEGLGAAASGHHHDEEEEEEGGGKGHKSPKKKQGGAKG